MAARLSRAFSGLGLLLSIAATAHAAEGLPALIERVRPSIVAIATHQALRSPSIAYRGTGFVVGDGNLVATNDHVLPDALAEGESLIALAPADAPGTPPRSLETVALDPDHDLALLRMSGPPLPALALRDSAGVRAGQAVAFTGFPLGGVLGLTPVTHRGIVAAVTQIALPAAGARQLNGKTIRRLKAGSFAVFQLDATAYPGNSGSPLYDAETGEAIGIINMVFVKGTKEAALSQPSGITFAVPAEHLRALLRARR